MNRSYIELRSDTCTLLTDEMRKAMAEATVGDDVFCEDTTVIALEEMAKDMLGKEAALFLPSGTMGNLVAVLTHCQRGEEIILESECHINYYEVGGIAALAGVMPRTVAGDKGILTSKDVLSALRPTNVHYPKTSCVAIENTHNRGGGTVYPLENIDEIGDICKREGLKLHMDGARIFNASIATGVPVKRIVEKCDSVQFCLSKGLCAPVGSVIVGTKDFIAKARANRKMLGGGMRQSGVLAACGIVALEKMIDRLVEDHINAKTLAERLCNMPSISIDLSTVQTNIIVVDISRVGVDCEEFAHRLLEKGIKVTTRPPYAIRLVTSREFRFDQIDEVVEAVNAVIKDVK